MSHVVVTNSIAHQNPSNSMRRLFQEEKLNKSSKCHELDTHEHRKTLNKSKTNSMRIELWGDFG